MCTGRDSNQGPLGPKSDALTTAPFRHLLLCQRDNETIEHYILSCLALDSARLPILNQISISNKNLTGKTFERLESNLKIQIIIDCSFLISQKIANRSKVRIQDLSELEFHSRRLAHVLYVHRYSLLNKTV